MQNFFDSLEEQIIDLQKSIDKMNDAIVQVNTEHESLKTGTKNTLDVELHEDLDLQISEMTNCISEHMKNAEEMLAHIMDEDRLRYMSNITALQHKMSNRGK